MNLLAGVVLIGMQQFAPGGDAWMALQDETGTTVMTMDTSFIQEVDMINLTWVRDRKAKETLFATNCRGRFMILPTGVVARVIALDHLADKFREESQIAEPGTIAGKVVTQMCRLPGTRTAGK